MSMSMSILSQSLLSCFAFLITANLLRKQRGGLCLAVAAGCFYYLHPIAMTFGLAALIFWDRAKNQDESVLFSLWPSLAGAIAVLLLLTAPQLLTLATTSSSLPAVAPKSISFMESLHHCLAVPLVQEYLCRLIVFAGLVRVGCNQQFALLAAALFFACLVGQPSAFLAQAAAGTIYGALYLRHGFFGAVTAHSLYNVSALIAAIWL